MKKMPTAITVPARNARLMPAPVGRLTPSWNRADQTAKARAEVESKG